MKKWFLLVLFFLSWISAGVLISASSDSGVVSFDSQNPQRIIALAPNLAEIVCFLGLEERIVAVTSDTNWPKSLKDKPRTGSFWQPGIEAVIMARPDLVITLDIEQHRVISARLDRMGIKTLALNIEKVNELYTAVEKIGLAAGIEDKARQLAAQLRDEMELSNRSGPLDSLRVLWVVQRVPLRIAGTDTFVNELIELAGGINAIGPTINKYPPLGTEQLISCGADVIIEASMGSDDLSGQQKTAMDHYAVYKSLDAVKNGRIYVINGDTVSRLSPRTCEGIYTIRQCLEGTVK